MIAKFRYSGIFLCPKTVYEAFYIMNIIHLRGTGSFLRAESDSVSRGANAPGGILATLGSSQGRELIISVFNEHTKDFAIADSHGQIFYFNVAQNKYQLVRLAGTSPVSCMCFLHAKLHYLCVAYEAGNIIVIDTVARKSVLSMQADGSTTSYPRPIRMLRCHPQHSMLIGYCDSIGTYVDANNIVTSARKRTLSVYNLKRGVATRTMIVNEDVVDVAFVDPKVSTCPDKVASNANSQ